MTEPFKHQASRHLSCLEEYGVKAGITTRQNGYSEVPYASLNMGLHVGDAVTDVLRNRKELANDLGFPLEQWVMGQQVHGTGIHVVKQEDAGRGAFAKEQAIADVDGLITNQKDLLLTAFYADCVPLLFIDPVAEWIGIAHAGWKGTVHDMTGRMVTALTSQGATVANLRMVIGPAIGERNYEVDHHVIQHIPEAYKKKVSIPTGSDKYLLDLKELNKQIAIHAGLRESHIYKTNLCTFDEEELFYSHRRDHGKTGRMLAYIGL